MREKDRLEREIEREEESEERERFKEREREQGKKKKRKERGRRRRRKRKKRRKGGVAPAVRAVAPPGGRGGAPAWPGRWQRPGLPPCSLQRERERG